MEMLAAPRQSRRQPLALLVCRPCIFADTGASGSVAITGINYLDSCCGRAGYSRESKYLDVGGIMVVLAGSSVPLLFFLRVQTSLAFCFAFESLEEPDGVDGGKPNGEDPQAPKIEVVVHESGDVEQAV